MNLTSLRHLGLTEGEIIIYRTLLKLGELPVSTILTKTSLKKGDCYNKLYDLAQKGLIEEFEKNKKKHFRLVDPRRLDELTASQYQVAIQAKREVEALLPGLLSEYALNYHKPGIVLFEGEEAIRRTLEDSLLSTTPIYSFVDAKAANRYMSAINKKFIARRAKSKKLKKMLVSDNHFNRQYFANLDKRFSDVRLIKHQLPDFAVSMQIYDNKISYLTLQPSAVIGVIIEDPAIALMHRGLFEALWQMGYPLDSVATASQTQP